MKKTLWIIVGIVVVVLVVWMLQKKVPVPYSQTSGSPTPSSAIKTVSKGTKAAPSAATATYQALLTQYAGKLIQFDDQCHGTPGQLVVKKGAKIMLDNRSTGTLEVGLDNQNVSLAPYRYQIVTITTGKALPYNMGIDCKSVKGSNANTTTVQIQASILQLLP
jgi:hypothetical protein